MMPTAVDALYAPIWLRLLIAHEPLDRRTADTIIDTLWPAFTP